MSRVFFEFYAAKRRLFVLPCRSACRAARCVNATLRAHRGPSYRRGAPMWLPLRYMFLNVWCNPNGGTSRTPSPTTALVLVGAHLNPFPAPPREGRRSRRSETSGVVFLRSTPPLHRHTHNNARTFAVRALCVSSSYSASSGSVEINTSSAAWCRLIAFAVLP